MKRKIESVLVTVGVLVLIGCIVGFAIIILKDMSYQNQPETINLTMEHLWEEDSKYYFTDNNNNVYMLGNYRDVSDKIMYDDLPKQRFERLNKGSRYEIRYVSGLDYWISISEREIGK